MASKIPLPVTVGDLISALNRFRKDTRIYHLSEARIGKVNLAIFKGKEMPSSMTYELKKKDIPTPEELFMVVIDD